MRFLIRWILLVILLVGCAPVVAETAPVMTPPATATSETRPHDLIYVVDPGDGRVRSSIFAVDAQQPQLVFSLQTRMLPEVAPSSDGRLLYVADSYLSAVTRGEQIDVYSIYDARSGTLLQADLPLPDRLLYKAVPMSQYPFFLLAADDSQLFVRRYGDPEKGELRLSGVKPATGQILFTGPDPPCSQIVRVWVDRWLCFIEEANRPVLAWVDPNRAEIVETVHVFDDGGYDRLALTADGRILFVLGREQAGGNLTVPIWQFDLNQGTVWGDAGTITIPENKGIAWQGAALSPDGSRLYVSLAPRPCCGLHFDEIYLFDTTTWERVGRLVLPAPASHLGVSRDGETVFVLFPETQQLIYYDAHTLTQWGILEGLGERPFQLIIPN